MLYFQPWVGTGYQAGGDVGFRLLLLGESHYGVVEDYLPSFTISCVNQLAIEQDRHPFFNRVQRTIQGASSPIGKDERSTFWHGVAFANFIQEFPGSAHNARPTTSQWKAGRSALLQLLRILKPDCMVVLGNGVGHWLPDVDCAHIVIRHPSSRGFSPSKWHPVVRDGLGAYLESR